MVDLSKLMQDAATLEVIEKSAHDIEAYRGALGYSVSGEHDGRLSDGTFPNNGIAEALNNECRNLSAQNSAQAMRIEELERENAALKQSLEWHLNENAALAKDAERYRWLRSTPKSRDITDGDWWWTVSRAHSGTGYVLRESELDAAIDEARSKT